MKVILFRNGEQGEVVTLPGEYPMVELSDLLGGEIEFVALDKRLQLVRLEQGEEMDLPIRYGASKQQTSKLGYGKVDAFGDCVVVCCRADGVIVDAKKDDCLMANLLVEVVQPHIERAPHDCEQKVMVK